MTPDWPEPVLGARVSCRLWFGWEGLNPELISDLIEDAEGRPDRQEERAYLQDLISRPGAVRDSLYRAKGDLEASFGPAWDEAYDKRGGELTLGWRPRSWQGLERLLLEMVEPGLNSVSPHIRRPNEVHFDALAFRVIIFGGRTDFVFVSDEGYVEPGEGSLESMLPLFHPTPTLRGPRKLSPAGVVARLPSLLVAE